MFVNGRQVNSGTTMIATGFKFSVHVFAAAYLIELVTGESTYILFFMLKPHDKSFDERTKPMLEHKRDCVPIRWQDVKIIDSEKSL